MTENEGFLSAIREDPDNDAHRLIYADWLDDHDQAEQAELIRVQCRLATMPADDPVREDLLAREAALLAAHCKEWAGRLLQLVADYEVRRGFVEAVKVAPRTFVRQAETLFNLMPLLRQIQLHGYFGVPALRDLARCPWLARLHVLTCDNRTPIYVAAGFRALICSVYLESLRELNLNGCGIDNEGLGHLASATGLGSLTTLDLENNNIGTAGIQALANSPLGRNLRDLNLCFNRIGNRGAEALARSPHLSNLTRLNLAYNGLIGMGMEALAGSPTVSRLTHLSLQGNPVKIKGAMAIANSPYLSRLTYLNASCVELGDRGARILASSPNLANLTELDLSYSCLHETGSQALLESPHLQHLRVIDLRGIALSPAHRRLWRERLGRGAHV